MIKKIGLSFAIILPFTAFAQTNSQWLSAGAEGKINKKLRFEFEEGFRFSELFTIPESSYSDFGINYRITKEFRIGAIYRFTQRGSMFNVQHLENRFSGELSYRHKFNDLKIISRLRYQSRYRDYNSSADGLIPHQIIRCKLTLDYDLPDGFSASLGTEVFWQLTAYYSKGFNSYWLFGGLDYNLSKQDKIGLNYIWQSHDFNRDNISNNHVISLSYSHSFDLSASDE